MVIGVSGGGKSTLLKLIMEAYKTAKIAEIELVPNIKIAYVEQSSAVNPSIPIRLQDFVALYTNLLKKPADKYEEYCKNAFEKLGLTQLLGNQVRELSGGEMKKLLFFVAISQKADLFLLDEIDAHLDLNARNILYEIVDELKERFYKSFLITSHDLFLVSKTANEIIHLEGEIKCLDSKCNSFFNINEKINELRHLKLYHHSD
jgi:zinc transport system ATP-binding protein